MIAGLALDRMVGGEATSLGHLRIERARMNADVAMGDDLLCRPLRADISDKAWASVGSTLSRPFLRPRSHKIAIRVINHHSDEALKELGA